MDKEFLIKDMANIITTWAYRNSSIESLHSGTFPTSKVGDFSDVKVVSPFGEIPWNSLSRISDEEMKKLNKEIHNRIYTFLHQIFIKNDPFSIGRLSVSSEWEEPTIDAEL
jgi:hypothetical protein